MKCILRNFELISGLRVNFTKSSLFGFNLSEEDLNTCSALLQCKIGTLPFKYLGIPVGANPRRLDTWRPLVDLMKSKLATCKSEHISFGGRLILVNSVLAGLPTYFFSFMKAPKQIVRKLTRIQRRFLWGGSDEENKISWIKWKKICMKKEDGGLNVKNLEWFNHSLLTKWKWRLLQNDDALWKQILRSKYGILDNPRFFRMDSRSRSKHSIWWRDITNLSVTPSSPDWFLEGLKKSIGDGSRTKFWHDTWVGNTPLRVSFNRLYRISNDKDKLVAEMGYWRENQWQWKWEWRREFFTWEQGLFDDLLQLISNISLSENMADSWQWKEDPTGKFTTKSAYNLMTKHEQIDECDKPFLKLLWESSAPLKIQTFVWRVSLNRIPTKINLSKRGVHLEGNDLLCSLCGDGDETSNHLFFECPEAYKIWMACYKWLGIQVVLPANIKDHFHQHKGFCPNSKSSLEWCSVWFYAIWVIWSTRNRILFRGEQLEMDKVVELIIAKSWSWIKSFRHDFCFSFTDWFRFPLSCLN